MSSRGVSISSSTARTVQVRAIDTAGKPLAGIRFAPRVIRKVGKQDANVFTESSEIARVKTDERGVATFDWLPPTTAPVFFVPTSEGYHTVERPGLQEQTGTTVTVQLSRDGTIRGRVVRPDGKPAAGILVMTEEGRGRGYTLRVRVRTAADGSYEMTVLSDASYTVTVADDEWSAPSHVDVKVREGHPVEGLDFRLARGTLVHGTLTIGPDRRPGEGRTVSISEQFRIGRSVATDDKGRYQVRVGPGTYALQVPNENLSSDQVTDVYEEDKKRPGVKTYHRDVVVGTIAVKDEAELIHDLWIPKPQTGPISGRVVLANDPSRGVAGAKVRGMELPMGWEPAIADSEGRFHAQRKLQKLVVHARSPDGSLAGLIEIRGDDREIVIPVSPTATAVGIILDERGKPVANAEVASERYIRKNAGQGHTPERYTPTALTDERGRFALPELLVGQEYEITVPAGKNHWYIAGWVKPHEAGPLEVGTLEVGSGGGS